MKRTTREQPPAVRPPSGGRVWLALAGILLVGLGLRSAYLVELRHTPDFAAPLADPAFHDYWASALVTGDWTPPPGNPDPAIRTTAYLRPPGYPYFLAAVYWVAGPQSYMAARLVQMGLGLVTCVLAWGLGRALFGRGAGLLVALFVATHWACIYYEGELQEPCLLVLLLLGAVWVLHAWARQPSAWRALVAGVLLGVFALLRPNILLCVPVVAAWMIWVAWRRRGARSGVPAVVALLLGAGLTIAPATIRNYVVARDLVLVSSNGPINLYIGYNERSDGYTARIPDLYELSGENAWSWFLYPQIVRGVEARVGRTLRPAEVAAYFRGRAASYIREHPWHALQLTARRALLFGGPMEVANNKEVHFDRSHSNVLRWLPGWPLALAAAALSLALYVARRRAGVGPANGPQYESIVLIAAVGGAYFASFLPFLVAERFRVTLAPLLALIGSYALVQLARWAQAREWRPLCGWGLAGVVLFGLAQVRVAAYTPQLAGWHMARGDAYARSNDFAAAAAEYARAIELKPEYLEARKTLATALGRQGRAAEALAQYEALLTYTPQEAGVHHEIGRLRLELQQPGEAEAALRRALALRPDFSSAHAHLGTALHQQGRLDEAIAAFRAALSIDPNDADAHYNLGLVLVARGAADEAAQAYRAAIAHNPQHVEAHVNLGILLAAQGQYTAAIAEYRQAQAIAPNRFEPYFNLAAALAAQGQHEPAAAALQRVLELKPDFTPARQALEALRRQREKPAEP